VAADIEFLSAVILVSDEPERLADFYRDALGLHLVGDVERGGSFWATLTLPDQPGVNIVLSDPYGGRSQEDGDAMAKLLAKGALNGVSFAGCCAFNRTCRT